MIPYFKDLISVPQEEWPTRFILSALLYTKEDAQLEELTRGFARAGLSSCIDDGLCWIAGGFVRRWIDGTDVLASDIDLFFPGPDNKLEVENRLLELGYEEKFRCPENKLTTFVREGIKVQCIANRYYGGPRECISTFDLTVSMFAVDHEFLYCGPRALVDLNSRALVFNILPYPFATMRRLLKYAQDGFWLPQETSQDFVEAVRTGRFVDGRGAQINAEDSMRWYID